jgi:transposase-like protein
MESPKTLLEAIRHFSDEQVCIDAVAAMRWPTTGPVCPECEAGNPYYLKTQKRWKCRDCRIQFSVKRGTIFEDSPISLTKWLPAMWLLVNCKNGISSYEVHRDLGVSQKTAWFMLHRLRLVVKSPDVQMGSEGGGEVEADETYVGGKTSNMHKSRLLRLQKVKNEIPAWKNTGAYYGKAIVHGILDRDTRKVRAKVVPNVRRETLQGEILKNVKRGSAVYTDQAVAYDSLKKEFIHETVNHVETYVKGRVHTNGLENFWSLTKRTLKGTYVAVEPFHLDRYLDEQVFRFNNRATKDNPLDDYDRFLLALSQVSGKRLTFAEVTGKLERPAC